MNSLLKVIFRVRVCLLGLGCSLGVCTGFVQAQNAGPVVYLNGKSSATLQQYIVNRNTSIALTAAGSYDPDSNDLNYLWQYVPGSSTYSGAITIQNSSSPTCQVQIPSAANIQVLRIRLTVSDTVNPALSVTREVNLRVQNQTQILPLGDSITSALWNWNGGYYQSYRRWLWEDLVADGPSTPILFIGSQFGIHGNINPGGTWDARHEGHAGATASDILFGVPNGSGTLAFWLENYYRADITLLHIGSNDAFTQSSAHMKNVTEPAVRSMITLIRDDNPNAIIVLAKIIPTANSGRNFTTQYYNGLLDTTRSQMTTDRSPIYIADMGASGIGTGSPDMLDGLHPTSSGEKKMADIWFNQVAPLLRLPTENVPTRLVTSLLPDAEQCSPYSFQVVRQGGSGGFSWSVVSGSLPAGISLNASTGLLSGTPTTAGSSPVTIKVVGSDGSSQQRSYSLDVTAASKAPTAVIAVDATNELTVMLNGTGSFDPLGSIVTHAWDFGDGLGVGVVGPAPTYTYATPGTYPVVLTVVDSDGFSGSVTQSVTVTAVAPVASFTQTASEFSLNVDASASMDPVGSLVSMAWNFGDGSVLTGTVAMVEQAMHSYTAAGTYVVSLSVTDNAGAVTTTNQSVTISAVPPLASFVSIVTELQLHVDGSGSSDPVGGIVSYAWDFGDGTLAMGAIANHTYAAPGSYLVGLTVTDTVGAQSATTQSVSIVAYPPIATLATWTQQLTLAVVPTGSFDPDGVIVDYAWDFGDGFVTNQHTASHTYSTPGVYPVTLTLTDSAGLTSMASTMVSVVSGPAVGANAPDANKNLGLASDASITGNASGRDAPAAILYQPSVGNYPTVTLSNSYGLASTQNLGVVTGSSALFWQCDWSASKNVNYLSFGGSRGGGQSDTAWFIEFQTNGVWSIHDSGIGGWFDGGIYQWGGAGTPVVVVEGLRVRFHSTGVTPLIGAHLRGTGGLSLAIDDSAEPIKGALIQYLGLDGDLDGIDDAWELSFGLDVTTDDSLLDPDGDGCSNIAEFYAGTNPLDPGSVFAIEDAWTETALGEGLWMRFPSRADRVYDVEVADLSLTNGWTTVLQVPGQAFGMDLFAQGLQPQSIFRVVPHLP